MARNYSNSPQQNSTGFWDTYNDRSDVQEYKKPSTCEEYISGKKKTKSNKKAKPSPALASLLFTTSKDEASSGNTAQYEPPSGPNAWSMRSGSALFKGEIPGNRRQGSSSSSGYNGRYEPYYPEPQGEQEELVDEEELLRKAIEESMRTAQEEEARKKRQEKEEEEWLSKVCAELKSDDKKPNWMQKFAVDITDDDFVPFTVEDPKPKAKPKPLTTSSISSMKNTETKKKQTDWGPKENVDHKQNRSSKANLEKKQTDSSSKSNVEKKPDWSLNLDKKQDWSSNPIIEKSPKKEAKQFEKPPLRDPYQEERKENRISHANTRFTNLYDDYDDDGSESEEPDVTTRQTYWHPQNQSHKWNQETWGGQNRSHSQRGGKQESWNDRLSNLRSNEDKLVDNQREAPREQRARRWKHDNEYTNAKSKDFHQNEHNGSPQKSRNFKVDFYKNKQNAEAQFELDNKSVNDFKKHVQFQRVEQSSSSESELGAIASNFAVSKISFDENLYSNQAQRSKTAHAQKVNEVSKPNVSTTVLRNNKKEYSSDERDSKHNASTNSRYKPPQSNNQTGSKQSMGPTSSPMHSNKPNVSPNSWKHKMNSPEPLSVLANEDMDQLEKNIKDITLDSISSGPFSPTNVRDELRAEVHLPQDNQIYNFYLNKQLGRANTQDQPDPYNLPSNDQTHAEPLPNAVQSAPNELPTNATDVDPYVAQDVDSYPSNSLAQADLYQLPNAERGQDSYKLPDNKPGPNSSLDAFMTNYVTMETERQLPGQSLPSYPPVSSLSSAPIMSSVPFSHYHGYPPPPPRHDVYGFNHFLSSQPVPYPHYPTASTPLPPEPSTSWSNIPNPPASWIASTPTPTHTPWSTSVLPPIPHTPWTNSSPWLPSPASVPPTLEDNALWRHLLAQAEHNPSMLEEMITSLNKSTSECNDPEQLNTLYAMSVEVDAAVKKLERSVQPPEELALPVVGEELVSPGRGRGGKREVSQDHVRTSVGMGRGRGYMPS